MLSLVPKLELGNGSLEAPASSASRDFPITGQVDVAIAPGKRELPTFHCQAGAWQRVQNENIRATRFYALSPLA
ncbi:MAG: hypothetical protein HC878_20505, partial [Leptolyngbyaceae cyanobacterium SL_5_14]|nr:hypothetical protein [Leptolyngbyaceae cyanobacterium SL_5_14]